MAEKNSSLEKALAVLDLFQTRSRLTMTEAAQATGYSNAAVARILNSLENMHYIFQDKLDGGYYLADKMFVLGRNTRLEKQLVNVIDSTIEDLSRRSGLSASVSIRTGNKSITIIRKDRRGGLSFVADIGDDRSLNCTASGKVLAAFSSDYKEISDKIEYTRMTKKTVVDRDEFEELLGEVRRQKLAFDMEEITEGLVCVAAPVLSADGIAICSISLSGYKERMLRELYSAISILQETARKCEKLLQ